MENTRREEVQQFQATRWQNLTSWEKDLPVSVRPGLQQLEGGAPGQVVNEGAGQDEAPPWPSLETPANQILIQGFRTYHIFKLLSQNS